MKIKQLTKLIRESNNIVFFGGAGVSVPSGIPDFRSSDGILATAYAGYAPESILSGSFLLSSPEIFFQYYREKILLIDSNPNAAHIALVQLEKMGKLKAIITQNIDGLHQKAGSSNVLELHGTIYENYGIKTKNEYDLSHVINSPTVIPYGVENEIIRPNVTLYGETLNEAVLNNSINYLKNADLLIIGGTSLKVYPAAGLLRYFSGRNTVEINIEGNSLNLIKGDISKILPLALQPILEL